MQMPLADRLTACVLFALGAAMAAGGWTMDRLEVRHIHPASIPGLVPMILGVLMMICAALLWREAKAGEGMTAMQDGSWLRLGLTGGLSLVYALVLVGWLPFLWATAIFVTAFAAVFSWPEDGGTPARLKALGISVALGILTGWSTTILFREVFLVRLP